MQDKNDPKTHSDPAQFAADIGAAFDAAKRRQIKSTISGPIRLTDGTAPTPVSMALDSREGEFSLSGTKQVPDENVDDLSPEPPTDLDRWHDQLSELVGDLIGIEHRVTAHTWTALLDEVAEHRLQSACKKILGAREALTSAALDLATEAARARGGDRG